VNDTKTGLLWQNHRQTPITTAARMVVVATRDSSSCSAGPGPIGCVGRQLDRAAERQVSGVVTSSGGHDVYNLGSFCSSIETVARHTPPGRVTDTILAGGELLGQIGVAVARLLSPMIPRIHPTE
jgi:hypothetical protein